MKQFLTSLFLVLVLIAGAGSLKAQHGSPQGSHGPMAQVDTKTRAATIEEIGKLLNDIYVYPEVAAKMTERVKSQLQSGAYDKLTDADKFADAVMADLVSVSHDKHLAFHYDPEFVTQLRERQSGQNPQEPTDEEQRKQSRRINYGFRKVERLDGNVGYLAFNFFDNSAEAMEVASAALNFLAHCDALIVDLRQNGGGDPSMIQFMQSYFFDEPVHLNDIYNRKEDSTQHFWTLPYVPGRKLTKTDIYVLISSYTFSGAEEFTYNLKNLKRATIIGENTGGGAHPVRPQIAGDLFVLNVPFARAINPITKTNWEGTGIAPDVAVAADKAYDTAYKMALEKLLAKGADEGQKVEAKWVLDGLKAKENPITLKPATAALYAGTYQDRKIILENGTLHYQRSGPKYKMVPMSETLFQMEGLSGFRLEFVMKDGKPTEVVGIYQDGRREPSPRTK